MDTRDRKRLPLVTSLRIALLGYCPNCHLGRLFDGLMKPRLGCDVCGLVYHRDSTTWLGSAFIMYVLACFLLALEAVGLGVLFGFFPGFIATMGVSAVLLIVISFRPSRAIWIWCLWRVGFLN